jgi:hypothetical protein
MRKLQHSGTVTHYTSVKVHTLMENDGKAGISSMFINITIYSVFSEGENEKNRFCACKQNPYIYL